MTDRKFKLLGLALACAVMLAAACGGRAKGGDQSTPTLAYKALYEAVKKKDSEAIKKTLSKGTLEMMDTYAQMQKKTLNQVVENGITETTFAPKLPETRDEKIWADKVALLQVKNEKTGQWDPLPFVKEDGQWKLAIDTFFKGTMSPTGPANMDNPGELPPGAQPGTPQGAPPQPGAAPGANPSTKQGAQQPGMPLAPGAKPPTTPPAPAPTQSAKPEKGKDIKPPTR